MGAREDFMAMRRAAQYLGTIARNVAADPVTCQQRVLMRVSASETAFIRLTKAGVQDELIDLAWALLGEERPGGPAVGENAEAVS